VIYQKLFVAVAIAVGFVSFVGAAGVNPPGSGDDELGVLATRLDLSGEGAEAWLRQLERNDAATERLLAVTTSGELVMAREGGRTAVVIGVDLDRLLRRPGSAIVLIHNHPSNTALSAADIGQLSKPGVAAVVAICRDRSVFMAAAGPRMDGDFLESHQYRTAEAGVRQRMELAKMTAASWPDATRLRGHLVARALAKAGIISYRADIRRGGREHLEAERRVLLPLVESVAARLTR
jgi:hypothetical protein